MASGHDHGGNAPGSAGGSDPVGVHTNQPADRVSHVEHRDGFDAVRASYPPILSTAQVAELLDLNPRTVLNMAGDGRLPASRLPGSRKFHFLLEEIIDTLKANRVTAE